MWRWHHDGAGAPASSSHRETSRLFCCCCRCGCCWQGRRISARLKALQASLPEAEGVKNGGAEQVIGWEVGWRLDGKSKCTQSRTVLVLYRVGRASVPKNVIHTRRSGDGWRSWSRWIMMGQASRCRGGRERSIASGCASRAIETVRQIATHAIAF